MNRFMAQVVLLGFSVLVLSGCGKSVEKETRRWESNQQKVARLKAAYPGYAGLISAEMDQAAEQWDQALQVADEEERLKTLVQVNSFVGDGVINELLDLKSRLSSVDRKVNQLLKLPKDSTEDAAASFAVKEAQSALLRAKELLRSQNLEYSQAMTSLSAADAGLKSAVTSLDKIIRTIRKNDQQTTTASTTQAKPSAGTSTLSTQTKSTTWKCSYCGSVYPNSVTKCKGCGAPRS